MDVIFSCLQVLGNGASGRTRTFHVGHVCQVLTARDSLRLSSRKTPSRLSAPAGTTCTTYPTEQTLTRHELAVLLKAEGPSVPRATFHPWGASRPHPMLSTPEGSARTWSRAAPSAKRFVVEPGSNSGRPHQLAAIGVIEPTAISAPLSISRRHRFQRRSLGHDPGVDVAPEGHQQFPRKRDNADAAHPRATVPKSLLIPTCERAARLKA